jgi:hypothetical protein
MKHLLLLAVLAVPALAGCKEDKNALVVEPVDARMCINECVTYLMNDSENNLSINSLAQYKEYCETFYQGACWKSSKGSSEERNAAVYAPHHHNSRYRIGIKADSLVTDSDPDIATEAPLGDSSTYLYQTW